MPISAQFLALKIASLAKDANKNRFTISEQKLKLLADRAVLTIPYLHQLKSSLEEFGYFLGSLKGGYGLFAINSLEGAPSLPNHLSNKELLETFTEAELYSKLSNSLPSLPIENDQTDEKQPLAILVFELLIKIIKKNNEHKKHKTTTPGELTKKLKELGHAVHHKKLEAPLTKIENYCIQREKMLTPNIKLLVVKGKPDSAIEIDEGLPKELKIIYSHSWDEEFKLFKQYIEKSDQDIARPNKKSSFMPELANPTENKLTPTPEAHPDVAVSNSEKSVTDNDSKASNSKVTENHDNTNINKLLCLPYLPSSDEKIIPAIQPDTTYPDYKNALTENHNSKNDDTELSEKNKESKEEIITKNDNSKVTNLPDKDNSDLPSNQEEEQKIELNQDDGVVANSAVKSDSIDIPHHSDEPTISLGVEEGCNTTGNTGDEQKKESSYTEIIKQMEEALKEGSHQKMTEPSPRIGYIKDV